MPKKKLFERAPINKWQAESLRLTVFAFPASPLSDPGWWNMLTGEGPQTQTTRAREGTTVKAGPFADSWLTNVVLPNRIDWLLTMSPEAPPPENLIPTIGTFTDKLRVFIQLMFNWIKLDSCPEIQRIALGAVLYLPATDKETAYRQLIPYLPYVRIDPVNSRDLFYQINRPVVSKSYPDIFINRLSKWAVSVFGIVNIQLGSETTPAIVGKKIVGNHCCRLELDLSTNANRTMALPRKELAETLQELVHHANTIVDQGDVE